MDDDLNDKGKRAPRNKARWPSENKSEEKMVKIKINPNRAIAGIGKAGDVVEVGELVAKNFVGQGLATIISSAIHIAEVDDDSEKLSRPEE